MDDAAKASGAPQGTKSDVERLHELGYAQELKRGMSGFSNFAVSFTIISILSGCLTLYGFGMAIGGPISSTWGWPLVGLMVTFVALAMGEVCSSYPTAGGLYYWSAKLAKRNGAAWSWFTGWFNMLGQVAITAGIDFGLAAIFSGFLNVAFDVVTTKIILIEIYTVVLVLHGLLNTFGVRLVALFNNVSVWWHVFGVLIVVLVLALIPDQHTSFSSLFSWTDSTRAVDGRRHGGDGRVRELLGVHDEPDRVPRDHAVHLPDRPAAGAVHPDRLRRLGAHDRGDPRRGRVRPTGDLEVGRDLRDLRLHPAARGQLRGAAGGRVPHRARLPVSDHGKPRGAGVDLPAVARRQLGDLRAASS